MGKPLLYWTIKALLEKGIKDIILVINPNSFPQKEIKEKLADLDIKLSLVIQEKPLGTGDAIFRAKDLVREPFLISWPYKVYAGEIIDKILEKYKKGQRFVLVGSKTLTPWEYGIFKIADNKVVEIVENPKPGQEPSKIKMLGLHFLEPDFFDYYQKVRKHHSEDFIDALNLYLNDKKASFLLLDKEPPTLKYPWQLFELLKSAFESNKFKNYLSPSAIIGKNVVIKGKVFIGENTKIGENTVINGPCYIGKNCQIGANNIFRGPVNLENNVLTGSFCEIKNNIIQEDTHLHSGYFGDSIIGKNCRFGAGFITANRRLDRENIKSVVKGKKIDTGLTYLGTIVGDNTRFGVQVSTMPGVLIGSNCVVGPGTQVFENLNDNLTLYTKSKEIIKKN